MQNKGKPSLMERLRGKKPVKPEDRTITEYEAHMDDVRWLRSMLSHNVRMPMSIVSGYAELLKNQVISEEKRNECLDKIIGNIKYLSHVISLLLDSNEDDIFNLPKANSPINLIECVNEVTSYMKDMAEKLNIRIQISSKSREINVICDYVQMMRVLYNMYENSCKYMNKAGTIQVTIDVAGDEVMLIYKDEGVGMEEEEVQHIFERNYQGSNHINGSGFGMYLVYKVVTGYGGTVEARSAVNQGMCIIIHFPCDGRE